MDINQLLNSQKLRYLLVGGWNTIFGYFTGIGIYNLLNLDLSIWLIGLLSNVVCISMSFLTYKIFVFRTKGNWLVEYFRSFIVYGFMAIVGIFLLWLFVIKLAITIEIAQALIILCTTVISYIGHLNFTFNSRKLKNDR
jgi:putative flippase GtrA